jgi:KipI family sensor histidine kinase inhibitor
VNARRVLPYGDRAWLVELDGTDSAIGLARAMHGLDPEYRFDDVVPADRTVLVRFDPRRVDAANVRRLLLDLPLDPTSTDAGRVDVPVSYDGADLDAVAALTGLTTADVVAIHTAATYRVGFVGFAPGFAYLVGGDPRLVVPRRDTPRVAVPAGSVALADDFCGIYPRRTPGGWQLIGRTEMTVWDAAADPPMPWVPGTVVRFVDVSC